MAVIWGKRGQQCCHPLPLQQELRVQGEQWVKHGSSVSPVLSQEKSWGWGYGQCHGLRLLTTVPQEITTDPSGLRSFHLCFKSCSGSVIGSNENQSVSPNRLEKTPLFIIYVTNSIALTLGNLHFHGEQFIFNYFIGRMHPLQT